MRNEEQEETVRKLESETAVRFLVLNSLFMTEQAGPLTDCVVQTGCSFEGAAPGVEQRGRAHHARKE